MVVSIAAIEARSSGRISPPLLQQGCSGDKPLLSFFHWSGYRLNPIACFQVLYFNEYLIAASTIPMISFQEREVPSRQGRPLPNILSCKLLELLGIYS